MHGEHIFGAVFVAVALAELAGDKTLYTIGSLSTRFTMPPLLIGVSAAFAVKSFAAVVAGRWLATLPRNAIDLITATACFGAAVAVAIGWRRDRTAALHRPLREATISCSAVLFSEWGDPGQIATALAAMRAGAPLTVWAAATAAMMTKAILVVLIGRRVRALVTPTVLQAVAFMTCVVAGTLAAAGVR